MATFWFEPKFIATRKCKFLLLMDQVAQEKDLVPLKNLLRERSAALCDARWGLVKKF